MGFKCLYYKLLVFYILFCNVTKIITTQDVALAIAHVPVLPPKQDPFTRMGKYIYTKIVAPLFLGTTDIDFSKRGLVEVDTDEFKSSPEVEKIDLSQNQLFPLYRKMFFR